MGSQYCRDLLALQLADWNRMQTDCYLPEERLRIFALLAGKPVRLTWFISCLSENGKMMGANKPLLLFTWTTKTQS